MDSGNPGSNYSAAGYYICSGSGYHYVSNNVHRVICLVCISHDLLGS